MKLEFSFAEVAKMYPAYVGPAERAVVAALVIGVIYDIKPEDLTVEDLDRVPDWHMTRIMFRSYVARISRSQAAEKHGLGRWGGAIMRVTLKKLKPAVRDALASVPRDVRPPGRDDDPHDLCRTAPKRKRVVDRAQAAAERELRDRIAAGQLPASMLATRMKPGRRAAGKRPGSTE